MTWPVWCLDCLTGGLNPLVGGFPRNPTNKQQLGEGPGHVSNMCQSQGPHLSTWKHVEGLVFNHKPYMGLPHVFTHPSGRILPTPTWIYGMVPHINSGTCLGASHLFTNQALRGGNCCYLSPVALGGLTYIRSSQVHGSNLLRGGYTWRRVWCQQPYKGV